jgi:hypothetical protein
MRYRCKEDVIKTKMKVKKNQKEECLKRIWRGLETDRVTLLFEVRSVEYGSDEGATEVNQSRKRGKYF